MAGLAASAPGKVLICGGYLVVEAPNVGLSIGVTARFSTTVRNVELNEQPGALNIVVESPQFGTSFGFSADVGTGDSDVVALTQTSGRESPFLFYAVLTSLAYLRSHAPSLGSGSMTFVLRADNDFYSQRNYLEQQGQKVSAATLRMVPPHNALVGDVSKTGLGSSAALTTSLVACICHALSRQPWLAAAKVAQGTETIHRVAQAAHSVAQGKIGSGFDVHTAVYGTNVYVRFPPARVDALMVDKLPKSFSASAVAKCVDPAVEWVPSRPLAIPGLPQGVHLILADIHQGGSATPGMVAKIMAWRKSVAGQPDNLWLQLASANEAYLAALLKLHGLAANDSAAYDAVTADLRAKPSASWSAADEASVAGAFVAMRDSSATVRRMLREVGEKAEVEVEPSTLTPLLDATSALPGVVVAGCPGAGGYDAVFALVVGGEQELSAVEAFWEGYQGLNVCPLLVREDSHGGLVVTEPQS